MKIALEEKLGWVTHFHSAQTQANVWQHRCSRIQTCDRWQMTHQHKWELWAAGLLDKKEAPIHRKAEDCLLIRSHIFSWMCALFPPFLLQPSSFRLQYITSHINQWLDEDRGHLKETQFPGLNSQSCFMCPDCRWKGRGELGLGRTLNCLGQSLESLAFLSASCS